MRSLLLVGLLVLAVGCQHHENAAATEPAKNPPQLNVSVVDDVTVTLGKIETKPNGKLVVPFTAKSETYSGKASVSLILANTSGPSGLAHREVTFQPGVPQTGEIAVPEGTKTAELAAVSKHETKAP